MRGKHAARWQGRQPIQALVTALLRASPQPHVCTPTVVDWYCRAKPSSSAGWVPRCFSTFWCCQTVDATSCIPLTAGSHSETELVGCRQSNKAHSDAEALKGRTAEDNQQFDSLAAALKDLEANYRQAGEHLVLCVCML